MRLMQAQMDEEESDSMDEETRANTLANENGVDPTMQESTFAPVT